ncbi:MAG: hypothetical protein J6R30_06505 [Bacteroidales bacterium]|nr:hypothetical protein [Bacteroidales bacterium]
MKKIYFTIVMLALSICSVSGMSNRFSDDAKSRIETEIKISTGGLDVDRSISLYTIEAFLFPATGIVEVNLSDIGMAEVYVVDSNNQIVDYDSVNTDIPSSVYLSTNGSGNYYVVIVSATHYAEGAFAI